VFALCLGIADEYRCDDSSGLGASGPLDEVGLTDHTTDGFVARSWFAGLHTLSLGPTLKVFALCTT
jgi:hypothetical protein